MARPSLGNFMSGPSLGELTPRPYLGKLTSRPSLGKFMSQASLGKLTPRPIVGKLAPRPIRPFGFQWPGHLCKQFLRDSDDFNFLIAPQLHFVMCSVPSDLVDMK